MSIWTPLCITLLSCLGWWLLVYPGGLRAEASILASAAALVIIVGVWIAYGLVKLFGKRKRGG